MYRASKKHSGQEPIAIFENIKEAKYCGSADSNTTSIITIYESSTLWIRGVTLFKPDTFKNGVVLPPRMGRRTPQWITGSTFIFVIEGDVKITQLYEALNGESMSTSLESDTFIFIGHAARFTINASDDEEAVFDYVKFLIIEQKLTPEQWRIRYHEGQYNSGDVIEEVIRRFDKQLPVGHWSLWRYNCKIMYQDTSSPKVGYYFLSAEGIHFNLSHSHEYVFLNVLDLTTQIETGGFVRNINPDSLIVVQPNVHFTIKLNGVHVAYGLLFINYDEDKPPLLTKKDQPAMYTSVIMNDDGYITVDTSKKIERHQYKTLRDYPGNPWDYYTNK
jgi:hypothetical protein